MRYVPMYYGINKMLLQLQFNVTSIGFQYWITAIKLYQKNYYKYNNIIDSSIYCKYSKHYHHVI